MIKIFSCGEVEPNVYEITYSNITKEEIVTLEDSIYLYNNSLFYIYNDEEEREANELKIVEKEITDRDLITTIKTELQIYIENMDKERTKLVTNITNINPNKVTEQNLNYVGKDVLDGILYEVGNLNVFKQNFVIILSTRSNEYYSKAFFDINDLKKYIIKFYKYPDGSGWEIHSLYDNIQKTELNFSLDINVNFFKKII